MTMPYNICFNSKKKNYTWGESPDNNLIFQYTTQYNFKMFLTKLPH